MVYPFHVKYKDTRRRAFFSPKSHSMITYCEFYSLTGRGLVKLPQSITERVDREFAEGDRIVVKELLSTYGEDSSEEGRERIIRDILTLAKGDRKQVEELVERARRDYRDIIFWAEYPEQSRLDTPEKKATFNKMLERFGTGWKLPEEGKKS